jgi:hypothetical protein
MTLDNKTGFGERGGVDGSWVTWLMTAGMLPLAVCLMFARKSQLSAGPLPNALDEICIILWLVAWGSSIVAAVLGICAFAIAAGRDRIRPPRTTVLMVALAMGAVTAVLIAMPIGGRAESAARALEDVDEALEKLADLAGRTPRGLAGQAKFASVLESTLRCADAFAQDPSIEGLDALREQAGRLDRLSVYSGSYGSDRSAAWGARARRAREEASATEALAEACWRSLDRCRAVLADTWLWRSDMLVPLAGAVSFGVPIVMLLAGLLLGRKMSRQARAAGEGFEAKANPPEEP